MQHPATFELPTSDRLTGLLTVAYFLSLLREDLLPRAAQTGEPFALMLLDTDNFHQINKTYGKACGDHVLCGMAEAMRAALPENALLARYGGDEFSIALPETRLDDAFTLAEEVRRGIVGMTFAEWPELHMTCSIGLAAYPVNGSNEVELLREADEALHVAKSTGRNKVALPLADSRMITKTSHYTATQLERLAQLAKAVKRTEATLLREALDDVLKKYNDRLGSPVSE